MIETIWYDAGILGGKIGVQKRRPRILLDSTQGILVPTKVSHQHNHHLNHIGLRCTVSTIFCCLPNKCHLDPGAGSLTIPKQKTLKCKANKSNKEKQVKVI